MNRDLTDWITKVLLSQRLPGVTFKELTNLEELKTMLAEQIDNWQEQWKATGIAAGRAAGLAVGRAEGLAEGLAKGRVQVLLQLLEEKFGPLDLDIQKYLYHLEEKTLLEHVKRAVLAKSLQEVIGQ